MTMTNALDVPSNRRPIGRQLVNAAVAIGVSSACFLFTADPIRRGEAWFASKVVEWGTGVDTYTSGFGQVVIAQRNGPVFFGVVTRSCSMTAVLLAVGSAGFLTLRGRITHRIAAVGAGMLVALVFNLVRIAATLLSGVAWGPRTMSVLHDVVGTPLTLIGGALAIVAMWKVAE